MPWTLGTGCGCFARCLKSWPTEKNSVASCSSTVLCTSMQNKHCGKSAKDTIINLCNGLQHISDFRLSLSSDETLIQSVVEIVYRYYHRYRILHMRQPRVCLLRSISILSSDLSFSTPFQSTSYEQATHLAAIVAL